MRKHIIIYSILICIVLSFSIGYKYQAIDEFLNNTNIKNGIIAVYFFCSIASFIRFNFLLKEARRSRDYWNKESDIYETKFYKTQNEFSRFKGQKKTLKAKKKSK